MLTNECGSTQTQQITITIAPQPEASVVGGTLVTTASAESYQWIDCSDNSSVDGATSTSFTPQANGNFAVEVTNGECTSRSECVAYTTMGNNIPLLHDSIYLYPNPVGNLLSLHTELEIMSGQIVNLQGQKIIAITSADTYVPALASGMYLVNIVTEKGIWQCKFVKQ